MIDMDLPLAKKISFNDLKALVLEFGGEWSEPTQMSPFYEGSLGVGDIMVFINYFEPDNELIINIGGDWEKGQVVADKFIAAAKERWGEAVPTAA